MLFSVSRLLFYNFGHAKKSPARWSCEGDPSHKRQDYSAAAASALAAFSLARSWAFLPGIAFSGLLRASRLARPASSRKRRTRSVGWAPCVEPMLDALVVQRDARCVVLAEHRVPGAELLDEAAVAGRAGVGNDDGGSTGASWSHRGRDGFSGTLSFSLGFSVFASCFGRSPQAAVFSVAPPISAAIGLMMPDHFLDDEVQELLRKIRIQIGVLRRAAAGGRSGIPRAPDRPAAGCACALSTPTALVQRKRSASMWTSAASILSIDWR